MTKNTLMMEMTQQYGHTVYTITAFGNPEANSTYEDRLLNLIQHEADKMNSGKESYSTSATNKEND